MPLIEKGRKTRTWLILSLVGSTLFFALAVRIILAHGHNQLNLLRTNNGGAGANMSIFWETFCTVLNGGHACVHGRKETAIGGRTKEEAEYSFFGQGACSVTAVAGTSGTFEDCLNRCDRNDLCTGVTFGKSPDPTSYVCEMQEDPLRRTYKQGALENLKCYKKLENEDMTKNEGIQFPEVQNGDSQGLESSPIIKEIIQGIIEGGKSSAYGQVASGANAPVIQHDIYLDGLPPKEDKKMPKFIDVTMIQTLAPAPPPPQVQPAIPALGIVPFPVPTTAAPANPFQLIMNFQTNPGGQPNPMQPLIPGQIYPLQPPQAFGSPQPFQPYPPQPPYIPGQPYPPQPYPPTPGQPYPPVPGQPYASPYPPQPYAPGQPFPGQPYQQPYPQNQQSPHNNFNPQQFNLQQGFSATRQPNFDFQDNDSIDKVLDEMKRSMHPEINDHSAIDEVLNEFHASSGTGRTDTKALDKALDKLQASLGPDMPDTTMRASRSSYAEKADMLQERPAEYLEKFGIGSAAKKISDDTLDLPTVPPTFLNPT